MPTERVPCRRTALECMRQFESWAERRGEDWQVRIGDVVLYRPILRLNMLFDSQPNQPVRLVLLDDTVYVKFVHASKFTHDYERILPDSFQNQTEFIGAAIAAGRRLLAD